MSISGALFTIRATGTKCRLSQPLRGNDTKNWDENQRKEEHRILRVMGPFHGFDFTKSERFSVK